MVAVCGPVGAIVVPVAARHPRGASTVESSPEPPCRAIKEKATSYATMQDVSFALVTDCELRDRPRQHLEPESPKEEPDWSRRVTPKAAIKPKAAPNPRVATCLPRGRPPDAPAGGVVAGGLEVDPRALPAGTAASAGPLLRERDQVNGIVGPPSPARPSQ